MAALRSLCFLLLSVSLTLDSHYDKMITDAASKTIINDQGKKVTVVDPEVKQNIQQTLMLQIFLKYDHLAGPPEVRK